MAALAGVRPVDTYGILAAFGRDCAGAIMVLPDGDRPGGNGGSGYSPMTPGDLQRVIGALDVTPLAAAPERGFRPSLAGFQRKALLGRAGDGTWQLPSGDAPSTWILKPDGPHAMAANEATCLRLAAACGLPVPQADLLDVAGLPVLAVKRYDRQDAPAGDIPVRVHQEDGCQATATPPGLKYEEQGGPALRDFADVIRNKPSGSAGDDGAAAAPGGCRTKPRRGRTAAGVVDLHHLPRVSEPVTARRAGDRGQACAHVGFFSHSHACTMCG
jgi:serine/threonine-protein kinase HipA